MHDTRIHRCEGAINPSAIIAEREGIRCADRQDVASWKQNRESIKADAEAMGR